MKIIVHDTGAAMLDLLARPVEQRTEALREILAPLRNPYVPLHEPEVHYGFSGFRVDRDDPRYEQALRQMREADVWGRMRETAAAAWERLDAAVPGVRHADQVDVVLMLGDPDDDYLVERSAGYLGMGGIPGSVMQTMWPTGTSLAKIPYATAHEIHHNVRYANVVWDPATVTVGEHVVAEGLAEAFVRELAGERAMGPWSRSLDGAELESAYRKITGAIDLAGMQYLTPYVIGDTIAIRAGQEPVGLPDFAGYAVGLRIVDAHLAATGLTAAESVALPVGEILANAGVPTTN
ncbi:DUF2268 domain-containing protein [Amycolatopsis sp. NPDC059021]|uniref:DUF2268 domain-containing protein n=1 Tax=Amycolatopsis sp. NPDC059021 TaxID=3346704 RepID=UPI003672DF40